MEARAQRRRGGGGDRSWYMLRLGTFSDQSLYMQVVVFGGYVTQGAGATAAIGMYPIHFMQRLSVTYHRSAKARVSGHTSPLSSSIDRGARSDVHDALASFSSSRINRPRR